MPFSHPKLLCFQPSSLFSPVDILIMHPTAPIVVSTVVAIGQASAAPIPASVDTIHRAHGQHGSESLFSNAPVGGWQGTGGCNTKNSFAETLGCLISVSFLLYSQKKVICLFQVLTVYFFAANH